MLTKISSIAEHLLNPRFLRTGGVREGIRQRSQCSGASMNAADAVRHKGSLSDRQTTPSSVQCSIIWLAWWHGWSAGLP